MKWLAACAIICVSVAVAAISLVERASALRESAQARTEAAAAREELSQLRAGLDGSDTITRATDGDTVVLERLGKARIMGINTPEMWERTPAGGWRRKADADPKAVAAYEWLRSLEGLRVRVQQEEQKRDRYGRALVHLYLLPDGPDLASEILRRGLAAVCAIPPNTDRYGWWRDSRGSSYVDRAD